MTGRVFQIRPGGPPPHRPVEVSGLPRHVKAMLAGAALAVSGAVAVAVFLNPGNLGWWGHGAPAAPGPRERPAAAKMALDLWAVGSDVPVEAGARLRAPGPTALRIRNRGGTELTLAPGTSLSVIEVGRTERFALLEGTLDAQVARLSPGERFIVVAGDAQIESQGTRFNVSVGPERSNACAGSTVTRVTVSEGVVAVRSGGRETKLVAGEDWRTTCPAVPLAASASPSPTAPAAPRFSQRRGRASAATAATSAVRRVTVPRDGSAGLHQTSEVGAEAADATSATATAAPTMAPSSSSLEAQNELFSAAMRAKLGGRTADALDLLGQFVDEYPGSALFESAMVQRMRLAAAEDPTWATSVATQYLTRFPDGFARAEAQEIIGLAAPP